MNQRGGGGVFPRVPRVVETAQRMEGNESGWHWGLLPAMMTVFNHAGGILGQDQDEALAIWRSICSDRWTLLDRFSSDGRRFLVVLENAPGNDDPRTLTPRERQVVSLAVMGYTNKLVAFSLGISISRAASHLQGAMKKLGVHSRVELVETYAELMKTGETGDRSPVQEKRALPAGEVARGRRELRPQDLRTYLIDIAGARYGVLSYALPILHRCEHLTHAERDVLTLLLWGLSNTEIALKRRTSVRTIANQVASIFRKLGVSSRSHLAAVMSSEP